MASDKLEPVKGKVVEVCRGGKFRCEVELVPGNVSQVMAYTSGKMKMFTIRIVVGDFVDIELSPYDLTQGRIIFREK